MTEAETFAVVKYWTLVDRQPVPGTCGHISWMAKMEEAFADLSPLGLAMVAAGHAVMGVTQ